MIPYWILFGVFALAAAVTARQTPHRYSPTVLAAALFLTIMVGLRYEVGGDWFAYRALLKHIALLKRIVDFWFPIYWRFRDNKWARRLLARIGGIHFYYGILPISSREQNYEWSLLDTHDGMTDYHKRYRTLASIRATLEKLGADDFRVWKGGNGVEAWARKPR